MKKAEENRQNGSTKKESQACTLENNMGLIWRVRAVGGPLNTS